MYINEYCICSQVNSYLCKCVCTIRLLAYPKVPVLAELVPTCLLCPVAFNELVWYSTAMRHTQDSVQILNGSTVQRDIIGLSRESEQL